MATYGDSGGEYPYTNQKRKKLRYDIIEKVIDFAQLPVTTGTYGKSGYSTTAWASGDVLQTIGIRAGETVLGVQPEILTKSVDSGDSIDIGYGDDADRWGRYNLSDHEGMKTVRSANVQLPDYFFEPVYFSSADTIDITINKAAIEGKIKLYVYVLKKDRI